MATDESPKPTLKLVLKLKNPASTDANKWVVSGQAPSNQQTKSFGPTKVETAAPNNLKRRMVYPKDKPPPDAVEENRKQKEKTKHRKELAWLLESSGKYGSGAAETDDGKRIVRQRKSGQTNSEYVYENDDDDEKNKKRKKDKDEDEGYYANAGAVLRKHREQKLQAQTTISPVASRPVSQPRPPPVDIGYSYMESTFPEPPSSYGPALVPLAPVPLAPVQPEKKKKKVRDPNRPKRAVPAYIFFANEKRKNLTKQNPSLSFSETSKQLGEMWKSLDHESRQQYEALAKQDLERYNREMASYIPPPEYQVPVEEREWEVEKILSKRINAEGELEYLVRWFGYGDESNSWEPVSELWKCTELIEDFEWQEEQRIALANQPREQVSQSSEQDPELANFLNEYSNFLDNIH